MGCRKGGKKRKLIAAFAVLFLTLVSGSALGQSYPPEFAGAMFPESTGDVPVSLCMTLAENIPYSVPDMPPCESSFWFGNFVGWPSASELDIYFFVSGERIICVSPESWRRRQFWWDADMQAYARLTPEPDLPWIVRFEVITVDFSMVSAVYREGAFAFSGHPPIWWVVSTDYPYFEYDLLATDFDPEKTYFVNAE